MSLNCIIEIWICIVVTIPKSKMCKNTSFEMFEDVFIYLNTSKCLSWMYQKIELLKINYSAIIVSFFNVWHNLAFYYTTICNFRRYLSFMHIYARRENRNDHFYCFRPRDNIFLWVDAGKSWLEICYKVKIVDLLLAKKILNYN